jgi:Uma2 family endonuclease
MVNTAVDLDTDLVMSRDEYHRWAMAQPKGRYERVDGRVEAMAPERASHAKRKAMVWLTLRQAVAAAGSSCEVYPDGMTIEVDENDYEPDAIVRCGEALSDDAITVPDPLVIVEVLSPGTRNVDLTRKLAAYFQILTLRHYLVFWAAEPRVIHHRRGDDGMDIHTRILTTGGIVLDPPGVTITVETVYQG